MGIITTPNKTPTIITRNARVRNGKEVDARPMRQVAVREAFVMQRQRKVVFHRSINLQSIAAGPGVGAGSNVHWRWHFHSGAASTSQGSLKLRMECGLLPPSQVGGDPRVRFAVDNGTTITYSAYLRPGTTATPGLDDIGWTSVEIDIAQTTDYKCRVELYDYARISFATVYEVHPLSSNTADAGVTDPGRFSDGAEITDEEHQQSLGFESGGHWLWRHNAAALFQLVPDWPILGTKFSTTSTSFANLLGGSTTVSSTSRGFTCMTQNHQPRHSDDVPCMFAVYAKQTGGSTDGTVQLIDSSGAIATIDDIELEGWYLMPCSLDGVGTSHKVDVQYKAGTSGTLVVESVCLYEYHGGVASSVSPVPPLWIETTRGIHNGDRTITFTPTTTPTNGDLLIVQAVAPDNAGSYFDTIASGWTTRTTDGVFTKVASSESGSYAFTLHADYSTTDIYGALTVVRADGSATIAYQAFNHTSQTTAGSSDLTTPTVAAQTNDMLISLVAVQHTTQPSWTPPGGTTERLDVAFQDDVARAILAVGTDANTGGTRTYARVGGPYGGGGDAGGSAVVVGSTTA